MFESRQENGTKVSFNFILHLLQLKLNVILLLFYGCKLLVVMVKYIIKLSLHKYKNKANKSNMVDPVTKRMAFCATYYRFVPRME